ncbi:MAG: hypothetical protein LQ340_007996, partial [Diploschistes diacapsis]
MQHMRDLGGGVESGAGEGGAGTTWIEAPSSSSNGKGKDTAKGKHDQSLADALRNLDLEHERRQQDARGKLTDPTILPSAELQRRTYQDQQDVPDALAGFQPDMDPRLREVLEALEDEAYVDGDEEGDLFAEIAGDRRELSMEEFEERVFFDGEDEDEDEGWESDRTVKPEQEQGDATVPAALNVDASSAAIAASSTPSTAPPTTSSTRSLHAGADTSYL